MTGPLELLCFHPAARSVWPQVEDQAAADQTETNSWRDERNQHGCGENRKNNE
jgi:hypothetical protein